MTARATSTLAVAPTEAPADCREPTPAAAVVFVSSTGQRGGAEQSLLDLAAGLREDGARVSLVCLGDGPLVAAAAARGVDVETLSIPAAFERLSLRARRAAPIRMASGVAAVLPAVRRLRRLVISRRPDIVHTNGPKAQLLTLVATFGLDVRLVWHVRDFLRPAFVERLLVRMGNARADAVVANSHAVAAHLRRLGVRSTLLHVVHNGIDCVRFHPKGPVARLSADHGWPARAKIVGLPAAFARWKGQPTFIEAARLVRSRCPEARFVLVGDEIYATEGHGSLRGELLEQIRRAGLGDVVALTGWRDDVPDVIRSMAVVVHASTEPEPFGRVIAEALACARPTVAVAGGGVEEITGPDGVTARLVPPGSPERLADAIVEALTDPAAAEARAKAGRARVARHLPIERHLQAMRAVYDEIWSPGRLTLTHAGKFYPPSRGGMETAVQALCAGMRRQWRVRAVVANEVRRTTAEAIDGVEVVRAGSLGRVASVPICPSLPWHLWRQQSDCVVLHEPYPWAAASIWLRSPARRLIIWHHSDILRPWWAKYAYGWLQRALYRRAACVVVASRALAEHSAVVRHAPRVEVIPFGIDLERFTRPGSADLDAARHLRAHCRRPSVLFVGRLVYYKGVDVLLHALTQCNADLRIVGDGPDAPSLRQLAAELGVDDRVEFLANVGDDTLAAHYHAADMFVLPSIHHTETFGLVQVEAMASGLPVISTRLPTGVPWVNQDGVTGLIVEPGDAAALARAIERLAGDAGLRRSMGQAGRHRAERLFSRERMVRDFAAVVEHVMAADPPAKRSTALKRAFDVALAGSGLIVSAPVWAALATAIKLEDGGPVFYAQPRAGRGGRVFNALKFRSMVPDAERSSGAVQASAADPRVTRVGRFMRATAMDELPQLWNIVRGDMSFVGPRALRPSESEQGSDEPVALETIPGYRERSGVRPGLTGVAQIYAPRDITRRHKFRYDRLYIRRQSFWLDIRLIVLSFWITFRGAWEVRHPKI